MNSSSGMDIGVYVTSVLGMKGWCVPVLKVLLWAFGAAVGGLCLAAGIGVPWLAPGPGSAGPTAGTTRIVKARDL